jgi:hypothetical protein
MARLMPQPQFAALAASRRAAEPDPDVRDEWAAALGQVLA